jgi:GTP cyclohydrolase II
MSQAHTMIDLLDNQDSISVERALAEFRAGRPVLLTDDGEALLVCGVETIDPDLAVRLDAVAAGRGRLVLPAARLRRLGLDRDTAGSIALPALDLARIETLALRIEARVDAPVAPVAHVDEAALDLARLALALPAVIGVPVDPAAVPASLCRVTGEEVRFYRRAQLRELHIISRATVPLEHAQQTEFVVFRGGEGMRDQVAIIVGKPDFSKPVPVRLHSACLTGDLFGSLKCDCGDQLRDTVSWMAQNGGGILLYLDQEGRGNGIANKMRAYRLQSQGFDTYDADEVLGFDLDQRRFEFAAHMLRLLGVTQVSALTNNPLKIAALRESGLDVVTEQRVIGRPTAENVRYLASKRDKAGHFIDVEALMARATPAE